MINLGCRPGIQQSDTTTIKGYTALKRNKITRAIICLQAVIWFAKMLKYACPLLLCCTLYKCTFHHTPCTVSARRAYEQSAVPVASIFFLLLFCVASSSVPSRIPGIPPSLVGPLIRLVGTGWTIPFLCQSCVCPASLHT